jgi:hypothetical protein
VGTVNVPFDLFGSTSVGFFQGQTTIQSAGINIPSSFAGQTVKLVFMWKSNDNLGTNPPASIDNISLTASSATPLYAATAMGGLWSSPATWVDGIVPTGVDVSIPAGSIVTVDQVTAVGNVTISGTIQWGTTAPAMTISGNLLVNSGGRFLAHPTALAVVVINIAGNFQNDGYANFMVGAVSFNGSGSTLSGSGIFQGDGTKGIFRALTFSNTGSNTISTSQNLTASAALNILAGSLNTNGKITLDNTAQVFGQAFNLRVSNVAVTNMGSGYTTAPIPSCSGALLWVAASTVAIGDIRTTAGNIYVVTTSGNAGSSAPVHTVGTATATGGSAIFLWVGTAGTIGNAYIPIAPVLNTLYFYGSNLYRAIGTTASGTTPPIHTSGFVGSYLYVGSPATVSVNWDSASATVRSLNLTNTGNGYFGSPAITFVANPAGSGAVAAAPVFNALAGPANSLMQKSGGAATISGGLVINSDQGASLASANVQAASGVGNITTANGGNNYTVAPTVGFSLPTGINLITNVGSAYTAAPTITITGGTLVSGTGIVSSNFVISTNGGVVQSVYLNTSSSTYSTLPTLAFSIGSATLAFPAGCLPTATANIGANGQLTSFTMTNAGFGYIAAPVVGVGIVSGTATGGTFTTVATAPTARIALYNLSLANYNPAPASIVNGDDAAIPANRKLNVLSLLGNGHGLTLTSGLTLFGAIPLVLTPSLLLPGNVLNLGGNDLTFTNSLYTGIVGTVAVNDTNSFVTNGGIIMTSRGGASTLNFPFPGTFSIFSGTTPTAATTGSNITRIRATVVGAPSNTSLGTGLSLGSRAYRAERSTTSGALSFGLNGTATLNFNGLDGLTTMQNNTFVADATALTGAWTIRSTAFGGTSTALPASGLKTTATTAPGPIVPTADSFYAFAGTAPTITSVNNTSLCASSGIFTITGTNLTGASAVAVGGTAVTSFTVVSSTQINAVVSSGTTGFVTITINGATVTGSQTITVEASPLAPTVSPASATAIIGGTASLTASGVAGTYNWYAAATLGTPLFTGATYSPVVCATTTFYVAENNGSCDGARTAVVVNVQPSVLLSSPDSFCGTGGSVSLSVTPNDPSLTYTWTALTAGAVLASNTGTTVTATITQTTEFKVTATSGSCAIDSFISVGVYPLPTAVVTANPSTGVCPGNSSIINSGLSAGNFIAACITAPSGLATPPPSAVILTNAGTAAVPLSVGSLGGLDDGFWNALPIGFSFNYFGTNYTSLNIGTNGTVNFGPTGSFAFSFAGGFPSTSNPANTIAVCARDLQLDAVGGAFGVGGGKVAYWTEGTAPNRKFIIQYDNCATWYSTNANDGVNSTEAVFYETTGVVDIRVIKASNPAATTGSFI